MLYRLTAVVALATAVHAAALSSSDDCRTRTVCADHINECNMMYGGCFSDCRPWPTFTPPPCPTTTTSTVVPVTTLPSYGAGEPCGGKTACVTSFRDCTSTTLSYGACYPACSDPPTFSPPSCPTPTTTSVPVITPPVTTKISDPSKPCGGQSICVDYLKTCGTTAVLTYGGCYPACSDKPTFTPPPCPTPTGY